MTIDEGVVVALYVSALAKGAILGWFLRGVVQAQLRLWRGKE